MKQKFYAYLLIDKNINGIVSTWEECQSITKGKKARFKSFPNKKEALNWLSNGANYENKKVILENKKNLLTPGIYFDAGTGRGIGVEVNITDYMGNSILKEILPEKMINSFGNYSAPMGSTNNYGELIGCYLALKLALKKSILSIFGDSKLVIDFWSIGAYNKSTLNEKTINLILKTTELRKHFEALGGKIYHISGDINPADLGFHR